MVLLGWTSDNSSVWSSLLRAERSPVISNDPYSLEAEQSLLDIPFSGSSSEIQRLAPTALAYLGDAVYELFVRRSYLLPPKRLATYHQQVVDQVRAEKQAQHLQSLMPRLSDLELDVLKRGRNAAYNRPKRLDPEIYQQATSLETLIGYLYLTNPPRLSELLSYLEVSAPDQE